MSSQRKTTWAKVPIRLSRPGGVKRASRLAEPAGATSIQRRLGPIASFVSTSKPRTLVKKSRLLCWSLTQTPISLMAVIIGLLRRGRHKGQQRADLLSRAREVIDPPVFGNL